MRNTFLISIDCALLLAVGLGCGLADRIQKSVTGSDKANANKTSTDVSEETTGIPECDEVMDMIAAEANNPDDGYIVKATKALFLNKLKESIRKSIEENKNKNGTADLAKTCTDYKKQLLKYKAEEDKKKAQ